MPFVEDIERAFVSRKKGRVLASIEDFIDVSKQQLEVYMKSADYCGQKQFRYTSLNRTEITRKQKW